MTSDGDCNCFLEIGHLRHVKNTVFQGEKRIDIREYTEQKFPTKKGISLTLQNWVDLGDIADDIEEAILAMDRGFTISQKWHIGRNVFVSIDSEFSDKYVDIRRFFLPEGERVIKPTKKGIALLIPQWHKIRDTFQVMANFVPALNTMQACNLSDSHQNQQGYIDCNHCTPNGLDIAPE